MSVDVHQLHQAACECIGWPFKARGRGPEGIDCFGLMLRLEAGVGRQLPDIDYEPGGRHAEIIATYAERFVRVEGPPEPGDVMLFGSGVRDHVGVYLGDGLFIHVLVDDSVVIQHVNEQPWRRTLAGVYRPKEQA